MPDKDHNTKLDKHATQLHESSGWLPETSYELLGKNGRLVVWGLEADIFGRL